jgi:hypothetical protein
LPASGLAARLPQASRPRPHLLGYPGAAGFRPRAWTKVDPFHSPLSIPRERVRQMSQRVQEMLGYSIHPPFMGHVNGVHPRRLLDGP